MAGRIRDDDIEAVRDRVDFAEVVREYVTLRTAGAGSFKGLCPFHEEKSPSFHIRPAMKHYNCFGCGESGGVFDFVMKLDSLTFPEAVERLATRAGIQVRYEDGGIPARQQSRRTKLVEAHRVAAEFYAEQLTTSEAETGRRFLAERGFDADAARTYGVGYAPGSWDALTKHLRGRGFSNDDLVTAGLAKEGNSGLRDRFVGRLLWPITDLGGDVVGFGARKLREDDPGPKYLNTPETPIYRKSGLLYGADAAKREIAKRLQVVVVEGYTDVMACHLAGVPTAVATCGTAFGEEHVRIVRRLLADQNEFRGEVIFTFDGDEAGRRAALKAFDHDGRFVTQTYVAVSRDGLDPCDLRLKHGDEAVRELVARRVPLFEFALRSTLDRYNLDTAEGRVGALHEAAPVIAGIRDVALRPEYVRSLAGWLGIETEQVAQAVRRAAGETAGAGPSAAAGQPGSPRTAAAQPERAAPAAPRPDPADPAYRIERESLRLLVQAPDRIEGVADIEASLFSYPPHRAAAEAVCRAAAAGPPVSGQEWLDRLRSNSDPAVHPVFSELAVETLTGPEDSAYASSVLARLREMETTRRVVDLKSRLQRINPVERSEEHARLFGELLALEQQRRSLRELALGSA